MERARSSEENETIQKKEAATLTKYLSINLEPLPGAKGTAVR